jgi:hypothetical protein
MQAHPVSANGALLIGAEQATLELTCALSAHALGNPFTLLNDDTATGRPAFSTFFHDTHAAFSLRPMLLKESS